jgi:hypothetical protein
VAQLTRHDPLTYSFDGFVEEETLRAINARQAEARQVLRELAGEAYALVSRVLE